MLITDQVASLCNLSVLGVSVVNQCLETTTTETQRTQRLHREELSAYFLCKAKPQFMRRAGDLK